MFIHTAQATRRARSCGLLEREVLLLASARYLDSRSSVLWCGLPSSLYLVSCTHFLARKLPTFKVAWLRRDHRIVALEVSNELGERSMLISPETTLQSKEHNVTLIPKKWVEKVVRTILR